MNGKLHKDHCTSSTSPTIPHGDWMTIEAEVRGNEVIRHFVNGEQVMEYRKPVLDKNDGDAKRLLAAGAEESLSKGVLAIQAESAPYDFKTIEILVLE